MNKSETAGGGPLLAEDYRKARKEVSDIVIAPFDENKAKGVGYNLAASMLVYSVNKKRLVKVKENDREVYIEIAPHDTVLTLFTSTWSWMVILQVHFTLRCGAVLWDWVMFPPHWIRIGAVSCCFR